MRKHESGGEEMELQFGDIQETALITLVSLSLSGDIGI